MVDKISKFVKIAHCTCGAFYANEMQNMWKPQAPPKGLDVLSPIFVAIILDRIHLRFNSVYSAATNCGLPFVYDKCIISSNV